MTTNEIIKALECIEPTEFEEEPAVMMKFKTAKEILGLIKRQQAEIDILIRKKDTLREENAELQAAIERLNGDIEWYRKNIHNLNQELQEERR